MKTKIILFFCLLFVSAIISAQSVKTYSLVRPLGGGDLKLAEFDLFAGTETIIKTYTPAELDDYNPEVSTYDHNNKHFITIGYDLSGDENVIAINITNGNIDHSYLSQNFEVFALEFGNGKVYSLARPYGGGDLSLLEIDLALGTETVVKTYTPAELDDYNPEATTFDHQNNHFIAIAYFTSGTEEVIAINTSNGNIDYTYLSATMEVFSLEYGNGKTYSITRPFGGGDLSLLAIDLAAGSETIVKTYSSTEIDDYIPGSTTFDSINNRFIVYASDLSGDEKIMAINISNGSIEYTYESTSVEVFAMEAGGESVGTPGGGGSNVGIVNNRTNGMINIYPNPASDKINISGWEAFSKVEIINFIGTVVISAELAAPSLDISTLPAGVYSLRLFNNEVSHSLNLLKK